jgi:iron-sulfur cluster assembly accessory protein
MGIAERSLEEFKMPEPIIKLTAAAAERVQSLMSKADEGVAGLRVGLSTRGCSGLSYVVEYAEDAKQFEEVVEDKGVKVFIDPAATMFLIGATMDYREGKFESGFVFENPNAKGTCGCGESFHV